MIKEIKGWLAVDSEGRRDWMNECGKTNQVAYLTHDLIYENYIFIQLLT